MRKIPLPELENYRIKNQSSIENGNCGHFHIKKKPSNKTLFVISSDGYGWDHVSVHVLTKNDKIILPTWDDMCFIKNIFFDPEETVVQFHPALSEYINVHSGVLHLWKNQKYDYDLPPRFLV